MEEKGSNFGRRACAGLPAHLRKVRFFLIAHFTYINNSAYALSSERVGAIAIIWCALSSRAACSNIRPVSSGPPLASWGWREGARIFLELEALTCRLQWLTLSPSPYVLTWGIREAGESGRESPRRES